MTSEYLDNRTASLSTQSPVPPSQARAAQIPLQTFTLPTFPPEAFSSATNLNSLILTSDIKLDEYTTLLTQPFTIPSLPPTIKALTLELFSLGYPPSFLTQLGDRLKALKSLTLYSQLLAGTTPESRDDAVTFITAQHELQELHLLDVFTPPGFWTRFAGALNPDLKFLELNYTFRHSDPEFLKSLQAGEVVRFVKGRKGLLGLTLSVSAPDVVPDDEDDREGTEVGVLVVGEGGEREALVDALVDPEMGGGLVMCDVSMFELSLEELGRVVDACGMVKVLGVSVWLEKGWEELLGKLVGRDSAVEMLEIVGVPGVELVEKMKGGEMVGLSKEWLEKLARKWKGLKSVKISILRTKMEQWVNRSDVWTKMT
ncbi:hypothetical protein EG329_006451 [Mollisiaceae sp. DMI_Dod_QoI]|nr:hypothetical protein EG329_006451 [Helotiales sp. DMI_Dod_QoI]